MPFEVRVDARAGYSLSIRMWMQAHKIVSTIEVTLDDRKADDAH